MNRLLVAGAFLLGLMVVAWVGVGYVGSNPLALVMTAVISAFYLMGALELRRFDQATASLNTALDDIPEQLPTLGDWLARLHPSLQGPVRLRVEGERTGLPGPAMTPYLVGLLVLLGMLGTFLGMVVTLKGAVLALESTTDLATIRAALAAPVKGLGLAFGTSVAGVAASAMLGLVSALCRRERLQAAQALDAAIVGGLHRFSLAHQRGETLKSLQRQAEVVPQVLGQMQGMMSQMERQAESLNERLLDNQDRFQRHAQTAYSELAASVDRSLKESLVESARVAGATIQPVVQTTMTGLARETSVFHEKFAASAQLQLEGLATRLVSTAGMLTQGWTTALSRHERAGESVVAGLDRSLSRFSETFEQASASLLNSVDGRHAALQAEMKNMLAELSRQTVSLNEQTADAVRGQIETISERFGATADSVSGTWRETLAEHQRTGESLSAALQTSLAGTVERLGQQSASLLQSVDSAHARMQADAAAAEQQRLAGLTQSLNAMVELLQRQWQQAGTQARTQHEEICRTLERTARDIQTEAEAHARSTIGEMSRLMDTASAAPRAAAEVVGLLRQQLSESIAKDNQLLDERGRIMAALSSLLEALHQGAVDQRAAIEALVASSGALLQQVGARFTEQVETETSRIGAVASEITGSALEVSSLGESFGLAVRLFSESSEALTSQLERIESALNRSTARSDEQLAYYVAQAREIIDLSISSQKQIIDDLRQLGSRQLPLASTVA